jgi:signal peptidase I
VVRFHSPVDGTRLVKHIAGIPGDIPEMRERRLFVNGRAVDMQVLGRSLGD